VEVADTTTDLLTMSARKATARHLRTMQQSPMRIFPPFAKTVSDAATVGSAAVPAVSTVSAANAGEKWECGEGKWKWGVELLLMYSG